MKNLIIALAFVMTIASCTQKVAEEVVVVDSTAAVVAAEVVDTVAAPVVVDTVK